MDNSTVEAGQEEVSKAENRLCHDSREEQGKVHSRAGRKRARCRNAGGVRKGMLGF